MDFESLPAVLLVRLSKTPPGERRCRMLLVAMVGTLLDLAAKGVKKVTLCLEDHERSSIKIGVRGGNDGSARAYEYAVVLPYVLRIVTAAPDGIFPVVELRQGPEGEVGACVEIRILRRVHTLVDFYAGLYTRRPRSCGRGSCRRPSSGPCTN